MKVTHNQVKYLKSWSDTYFITKGTEEKTITVQHKIPRVTGVFENHFPNYLQGFEQYYDLVPMRAYLSVHNRWVIKPEYEENRPLYSISTTIEILDIELTEEGKKEVQRRYELHKRNMEKYESLLNF